MFLLRVSLKALGYCLFKRKTGGKILTLKDKRRRVSNFLDSYLDLFLKMNRKISNYIFF